MKKTSKHNSALSSFAELKAELIKKQPAQTENKTISSSKNLAPKHKIIKSTVPSEQEADDASLFLNAVSSCRKINKLEPCSTTDQSMADLLKEAEKTKKNLNAELPLKPVNKPYPKPQTAAILPDNDNTPDIASDEAELFLRSMQDASPIFKKGRVVAPVNKPQTKISPKDTYEENFLKGKYEFSLEYSEEFIEGHVLGIDPFALAKLRTGSYSPEAYIDLHGLNASDAWQQLTDFIKLSYMKGKRVVSVVTGRGKNSPGGIPVLREQIQHWLTSDPLKRVVLAFCSWQPKDGGAGALYILLRKYKKNSGKIVWDKKPWGETPLL